MSKNILSGPRRNADVKCLRCEAMNIPENKVCGRCGANLPLVYDEEGNVFQLKDQRDSFSAGRSGSGGVRFSPAAVQWVLRFSVILFALLVALWIMRHR